jgi:hypothetical protein
MGPHFTLEDATRMMRRTEESKIRMIAIGHIQYTVRRFPGHYSASERASLLIFLFIQQGKWVLAEGDDVEGQVLRFVVSADVAEDKWKT